MRLYLFNSGLSIPSNKAWICSGAGNSFCKSLKKIIEFDGVYWHRNNPENAKREKIRDEEINTNGYKVLHVSELDYKNNPNETIEKCLDFLIN